MDLISIAWPKLRRQTIRSKKKLKSVKTGCSKQMRGADDQREAKRAIVLPQSTDATPASMIAAGVAKPAPPAIMGVTRHSAMIGLMVPKDWAASSAAPMASAVRLPL